MVSLSHYSGFDPSSSPSPPSSFSNSRFTPTSPYNATQFSSTAPGQLLTTEEQIALRDGCSGALSAAAIIQNKPEASEEALRTLGSNYDDWHRGHEPGLQ